MPLVGGTIVPTFRDYLYSSPNYYITETLKFNQLILISKCRLFIMLLDRSYETLNIYL